MTNESIDHVTFHELQDTAGEDFVKELVGTFLEEAPRMLSELREAFAAGNAEAFRRAAHSLKSNGNTFGASALATAARELELEGLPASATPIVALEREYQRAAAALGALCHG